MLIFPWDVKDKGEARTIVADNRFRWQGELNLPIEKNESVSHFPCILISSYSNGDLPCFIVRFQAHGRMHDGSAPCAKDGNFPGGITNGNAWYPLYGGMQDWNYLQAGCMEITVELSCIKYPNSVSLDDYWTENKFAMLVFLAQVRQI